MKTKKMPDLKRLNKKQLELIDRIAKILRRSKQPGQSWIFDWLNVEMKFLENYKRLKSWYGDDRVELTNENVLLDGRPVVNKYKGKEGVKIFLEHGT
jgi:hypothetical protein